MNSLKVLLAFGLCVLLLGCIQAPSTPPSTPPSAPVTVTNYVCQDGKTVVTNVSLCPPPTVTQEVLTPQETDMKVCSGMPSTQAHPFEDACIMGIAAKYKDTSICTEVSRDQRNSCYTIIAELESNSSICLDAGSEADQCYSQYATDKKDSSVCSKMSDVSYKDGCYSNLANTLADPDLCDEIRAVGSKDGCYSNIASRLGDSSYCEKITNSDQKTWCLNNIQGMHGQPK